MRTLPLLEQNVLLASRALRHRIFKRYRHFYFLEVDTSSNDNSLHTSLKTPSPGLQFTIRLPYNLHSSKKALPLDSIFPTPPLLTRPGIFITGTDTGVGKTVTTCAIAWALRRQNPGIRVGVCKPYATGCRSEREGLVSEDAEALAYFSDTRLDLDTINPIRFIPPMAPGPAARLAGQAPDIDALSLSLRLIDQSHDVILVEGVGGLLVPLDPHKPSITALTLAQELGYPALVVARAGLGTLNHTAMTCTLLKNASMKLAGLVVNNYEPDVARHTDASMSGNLEWLRLMNRTDLLAVSPKQDPGRVAPEKGLISDDVLHAFLRTDWMQILAPQNRA
jgi:dethiobiotin synthetase